MKPEAIEVNALEVSCEGAISPDEHPIVFLHIDSKTGQIRCPYCNRLYVLEGTEEHMMEPAGI